MSNDKRDILEVLKFELEFLEQGGYGRSVRTPWKPTSVFQDSPSCINFNDPDRPNPCSDCLLTDFVPGSSQTESVPCHSIPIGLKGEAVSAMDQSLQPNQGAKEEALKQWLRTTIHRIEQQRTQGTATPKSA